MIFRWFFTANLSFLRTSIIFGSSHLLDFGKVPKKASVLHVTNSVCCRLLNLRRLFYSALFLIAIFDVAAVVLFLIWLSLVRCPALHFFNISSAFRNNLHQGVVVQPALAIPYFTGVLTFIGNIISLTHTLHNWQETIVNKVLEQLQTFIDPIKPQLLDLLEEIILRCDLSEGTLFTGISITNPSALRKKLDELYCSIDLEAPIRGGATNNLDSERARNDTAEPARGLQNDERKELKREELKRNELRARREEASRLRKSGILAANITFRKLSEQEIVALLRSFWSSIR